MANLVEETRRAIEAHGLMNAGGSVIVAVSGGPDSVALLDVLVRLRDHLGITLHAAHLDHRIRPTSAEDAAFVADLAHRWGVACTIASADVPALAVEAGLSLEDAGRLARYGVLAALADALGATVVAAAHHADDQAETVLLHLLRGSGLAGLRGMRPSAPLPPVADAPAATVARTDAPNVADVLKPPAMPPPARLVRPFLGIRRDDIRAHVAAFALPHRLDPTNADPSILRNRVRLELLPLLATYTGAITDILGRTAQTLSDDYDVLHALTLAAWPDVAHESGGGIELDLAALAAQPRAVRRALVREALTRLGSLRDVSLAHIARCLALAEDGAPGTGADLPSGIRVTRGYTTLTVGRGQPPLPDWPLLPPGSLPLAVTVPGVTALPGRRWALHTEWAGAAAFEPAAPSRATPCWTETMDAGAAAGGLWLRSRRAGERFQPLGLGGRSRSLHDFMSDAHIPPPARDRLPIVANGAHIVWVGGFRLDHRARVTPDTHLRLRLRFAPREEAW
ncbi:MAG: tRNA lysidine(34) synthetase TilS [Anaerolineae bacterium]